MSNFLEHCLRGTNFATGKIGTPIDFVSFHAKGSPSFIDGHVRMGIANQLRAMNGSFGRIAGFPELKGKPVIIGESDPDGCAACTGEQSATATASFSPATPPPATPASRTWPTPTASTSKARSTWAFEFEDQPLFPGFRVLATDGIDLPVLNVFRMFNRLGGRRLAGQSDAPCRWMTSCARVSGPLPMWPRWPASTARNFASWSGTTTMMTCPALTPRRAGSQLILPPPPGRCGCSTSELIRITATPYAVWRRMGSPPRPAPEQYAQLEQAGKLAALGAPETVSVRDGRASLRFALPRQAVSLLVFEW